MKKITTSLLFCLMSLFAWTQEYFQQHVSYKITVALNDVGHELDGKIAIDYTNNSPDKLDVIYMHLWPNGYKDQSTALAKQLLRNKNTDLLDVGKEGAGFIDQLEFQVNGKKVEWDFTEMGPDVAKLILNEPLLPGGKINITTPFHVKIPDGKISRLGHLDQLYQITQWYPKPAVYNIDGWNPMPYLNQGEFFSEFGDFDVSITVPENYVLAATGDLINGEKEIAWWKEKEIETRKNLADTTYEGSEEIPVSSTRLKTLRFKQSKVHDFAWFADKRYNVLSGEVELPASKRKVKLWSFFQDKHNHLWDRSIEYLHDATFYYSKWNGDYPYNLVTAVDAAVSAGGGMEYPTITTINSSGSPKRFEEVVMHEVGHNWFYGILGSNEREHAWLDEGLNTHNEGRYMRTKYKDEEESFINLGKINKLVNFPESSADQLALGYRLFASRGRDQAMETTSIDMAPTNYGLISYAKTARVFDHVMAYLGEELYDKCMQAYFEKWKFKHPEPKDLQAVFEEISGKKMDWLWKELIPSNKIIDYKISSLKEEENFIIKVKNTGEISAPFELTAFKNGKIITSQWVEGFPKSKEIPFPKGDYDLIQIDGRKVMLEGDRNNNSIKVSGGFKKVKPLKLKLIGGVKDENKSNVNWFPAFGWNSSDKSMLGIGVHNQSAELEKVDFILLPLYSFNNENLRGFGSLGINKILRENKTFSKYRFQMDYQTFGLNALDQNIDHHYRKVQGKFTIDFKKKNPNRPFHQLEVSTLRLDKSDGVTFSNAEWINRVQYNYKRNSFRTSDQFSLALEAGESYSKLSLEERWNYHFVNVDRKLNVRLFAGLLLDSDGVEKEFSVGGISNGYDYRFDQMQFDRAGINTFFSRQFVEGNGGLKVGNSLSTDKFLLALNVKTGLPKLPIGIFMDATLTSNQLQNGYGFDGKVAWDLGVYVPLLKNVITIYAPLIYSKGLVSNKTEIQDLIRFDIKLNNLNLLKVLREIKF